MGLQETFTQQLEAQMKDWEKQSRDLKAKAEKAGVQARAEYDKSLKNLEHTMSQASKMLAQVQGANEAAWKDMETSATRAFEDFKKGWEDALGRYK